jgi:hypothetical protein
MKICTLILAGLLTLGSGAAFGSERRDFGCSDCVSKNELTLRTEMRRLWSEHVEWTRLYIVSALAELPDAPLTAARLFRNQEDIGKALVPYYGGNAGAHLTVLLKSHISIAAELIGALKAQDDDTIQLKKKAWFANAEEIAAFLSSANPKYFKFEEMNAMLKDHLDLTSREVAARLAGDWKTDIATYDLVSKQAREMADHFSWGIVKQFPKKFEH